MLFLVISTPSPTRPSDVAGERQRFWSWVGGYQASGICRQIYPRVGRGVVCILDVPDHATLHRLLNEWADIIPAGFDIHPLVDISMTQSLLASQIEGAAKPD